jgi:hypothetical protein
MEERREHGHRAAATERQRSGRGFPCEGIAFEGITDR